MNVLKLMIFVSLCTLGVAGLLTGCATADVSEDAMKEVSPEVMDGESDEQMEREMESNSMRDAAE